MIAPVAVVAALGGTGAPYGPEHRLWIGPLVRDPACGCWSCQRGETGTVKTVEPEK
jgi:hypothetical protein